MQENRFEKGFRDQMEDFQLRPSATVWEQVEKEIVRKKRRRVVYFIVLLAGLSLLGYTGYQFYSSPVPVLAYKSRKGYPKDSTISTDQSIRFSEGQADRNKTTAPQEKDSSWRSGHPVSKDLPYTEKLAPTDSAIQREKPGAGDQQPTSSPTRPWKDALAVGKREKHLPVKAKLEDIPDNKPTGSASPLANKRRPAKPSRKYSDNDLATGSPILSTDEINRQLRSLVLSGRSSLDSVSFAREKTRSSRPMKWGFELSIGQSNRRDQALPTVFGNKDGFNPFLYSGVVAGVPPSNYPLTPPSPVKVGIAYRVGVVAELPISKRSSLLAGLQYAYQTDRIRAGISRDTSFIVNNSISQTYRVDAVYAAQTESSKTNRYHLVQVPLRFQYGFGNSKKLPVSWEVGVNLGYLFASNALIYDTVAHGVYDRDKKAFQRFHLALASGVHFQWGKPGKLSWSIGPEVSLDMNRLVKNVYDRKQYPFYVGLNSRIFLPVKKKK